MIKLAAIKKGELIYTAAKGQGHSYIITDESRPFGFLNDGIKGFVDENGKFYNRQEAAEHAFKCGQLPSFRTCPNSIISSDLW